MDDADLAQKFIEQQEALTLQNRAPVAPTSAVGAVECADCGDPIPQGRREAQPGTLFCTECAAFYEGRARR